MPHNETEERITYLVENGSGHPAKAYYAVLDTVAACLGEASRTRLEHISGQDLARKFADIALDLYGPMAIHVLDAWDIHNTRDIGDIVFGLVSVGLLSFSPNDKIEDFDDVYDFDDTFVKPFNASEPFPDFQIITHNSLEQN